jgi:hypothetical protein
LTSLSSHRTDTLRPATVLLRISDPHGNTRRQQNGALSPGEFTPHRTANARFSLPLRDLPAGQYLLTLEATLADRRAERLVRFEMR